MRCRRLCQQRQFVICASLLRNVNSVGFCLNWLSSIVQLDSILDRSRVINFLKKKNEIKSIYLGLGFKEIFQPEPSHIVNDFVSVIASHRSIELFGWPSQIQVDLTKMAYTIYTQGKIEQEIWESVLFYMFLFSIVSVIIPQNVGFDAIMSKTQQQFGNVLFSSNTHIESLVRVCEFYVDQRKNLCLVCCFR